MRTGMNSLCLPEKIPRSSSCVAAATRGIALSAMDRTSEFLHQLRRHPSRKIPQVVVRVVFHDVRTDQPLNRLDQAQGLSGGETARFRMRNTRCRGGIQPVHIEGDVDRSFGLELPAVLPVLHLNYFGSETVGLLPLMVVHCPDPHLYQAVGETLFHDACKGAGVGVLVALELVVKIRMGVHVEDRERAVVGAEGPKNRESDGMVASENNRGMAQAKEVTHRGLDRTERVRRAIQNQIVLYGDETGRGGVHQRFAPTVAGFVAQ